MADGEQPKCVEQTIEGWLAEWNRTERLFPQDQCVHELFEQQVARTPEVVAVQCAGDRLTYAELNARANQLARWLRNAGVKPGCLVGVGLERSAEALIAIYAVLKAGGAYVPLDPAYPQERLAGMIDSARVGILLTLEHLADRFQAGSGVRVVRLDRDWPEIAKERPDNLGACATPEDLIYVIFTSGSTGRPKGAGVYHRGFTNLVHWYVTEFAVSPADQVLLVSSLSFDLTQKNLFAPLLRGGTLHLAPPGPYDVTSWIGAIQEHRITLINCTPSAFYPLVEVTGEPAFRRLASLRVVVLGGEPISIRRLRPWLTHPSCQAEIANTYGPTECTDICCCYRLHRGNLDCYPFVPLGKPIHNVQLAIVDEHRQLCPIGQAGELWIGGIGLGAGYVNDPALTAAKFVVNPFPNLRGARLYRTGDQARWLPGGIVEFLGRLDHQVKVRGFRIELHEIEAVLNTHPALKEAVVVLQDATRDRTDPRLVCFFSLRDSTGPSAAELKAFLATRLPDYMIPATFQQLSTFPLSPNGKVDRRTLATWTTPRSSACGPANTADAAGGLSGGQGKQPEDRSGPPVATDLAQELQQLWQAVVGCPKVGLDDNFFELGGNSLHLAQVHVRLQQRLGRDFPITDLFAHPTVRMLAAHLSGTLSRVDATASLQDRVRRQREALAARRHNASAR